MLLGLHACATVFGFIRFFIIVVVLVVQWIELRASFMLMTQALYCLNHASSPLCSGYFGDRISLFAQTSLDSDPPILSFLPSLG
jgi:hypothetical protein